MKAYPGFLVIPLVSAFVPSYLNPGRRFQSPRAEFDAPIGRFHQGEVSVEESLDAGKMQSYLQAPLMEHDRQRDEICEGLPNGTFKRPAFFMCKDDTLVTLHGGAVTNMEGDDRYPVDFEKPLRVFLDVTSSASRRYDNLSLDVSLYKRSTGWFGCGWMFLPSFGLLNNYDVCQDNPSCPLSPGRQVLEFSLDPSRLFTRLFRMIHYDMEAYQLVFHLRDNKNPHKELLCATIQTRIHL